jgi:hypothetical protein
MPKTAAAFVNCVKNNYPLDANQRCYRLDPMDNADGGSDPAFSFPMYSDLNAARMQRWISQRVRMDTQSPTKFSVWDNSAQKWLPYTPKTEQSGAYQLNNNLPVLMQTPLAQIALAL